MEKSKLVMIKLNNYLCRWKKITLYLFGSKKIKISLDAKYSIVRAKYSKDKDLIVSN